MARHVMALMSGLSVLMFANVCFSTLVTVDFSGGVEFAIPDNDFGLTVGDSLSGQTIYDDALLTGVGSEQLAYAGSECGVFIPCGTSLTFTIDTHVLGRALDDRAFLEGNPGPLVFFENGAVVGFDYVALARLFAPPTIGANFFVRDTSWSISDFGNALIIARGSYNRFSAPHPVPEPSITICLFFGLGLTLLLSALWRRQGV